MTEGPENRMTPPPPPAAAPDAAACDSAAPRPGTARPAAPRPAPPRAPGIVLGGFLLAAAGLLAFLVARWVTSGGEGERSGNEFSYDLGAFLKVDPELVLYEQTLSFDTGLRVPRGIDTLDGGAVCVVGEGLADTESPGAGDAGAQGALRVFSGQGKLLSHLQLQGSPRCVAAVSAERCYVGFDNHVEVHDSKAGARESPWKPLGKGSLLVAIAVARNDVFLADAGQKVILRCDLSGKLLGRIGEKSEEHHSPGLIVPSPYLDVAMGLDGLLRVANPGRHRIEAYTVEGDLEFFWGEPSLGIEGFSGCCNPASFAILPGGGFVTCEKGIPRVKLYEAQGRFAGVVAGPDRFVEGQRALKGDWRKGSGGGLDVAVDAEGRVVVLDPLGRNVQVYTRSRRQ